MKQKTFLAIVLVLLMAVFTTVIPPTASAASDGSFTCTLDSNGVLTIYGSGPMENFESFGYKNDAPWGQYQKQTKKIILEEGITTIGDYAFKDFENLTSIDLPDSLTQICEWSFMGCSSLGSIEVPDTLTKVGYHAFDNCISLTSFAFPGGVTQIASGTFNYCESLTSVTIPETVTAIGNYAFYGCSKLKSIDLPNAVTILGESAFQECSALAEIVLPCKLQTIKWDLFAECTSLTSVTLPDSDWVNNIQAGAFRNCSALSDVYYNGDKADWENVVVETNDNEAILNATMHYNAELEYDPPGWDEIEPDEPEEEPEPEIVWRTDVGIPVQSEQNWNYANELYLVSSGWGNNYQTGLQTDYHVYDNGDGTLSAIIVDETYSKKLYIERYDKQGKLVSKKTVPMELPFFISHLVSDDYIYVAYAQNNYKQIDSTETWRIVKYDRNWKKLGAYSATGGETDTYAPDVSLISEMALSDDGKTLVLHTARNMYADGSGTVHQASITFLVDTETMTEETEKFEKPMTYSHSLGQFVFFDGDKLVSVDQGDAFPGRCFGLQTGYSDGRIHSFSLLGFAGQKGDTITNAVGCGFEKTDEGYLFLCTSCPQDGVNFTPWNLCLRFVEKAPPCAMPTLEEMNERSPQMMVAIGSRPAGCRISRSHEVNGVTYYFCPPAGATKFPEGFDEIVGELVWELDSATYQYPNFTCKERVWLTDSKKDIGCARLVKMNDSSFVVMWGLSGNLHWQQLNGRGEPVGQEHVEENVPMPPSQPVVVGNTIRWIQTVSKWNMGEPQLFTLNVKKGALELPDGLHKGTDGLMRYYRNGAVDANYTNFVTYTDGTQYYVKSGVQVKTTGLVSHTNGKQYYVKGGVRQHTTGLVKHTNNKWYHVVNGVRQYTNGLVLHTNGKLHYVENGVLTKITNFIKHTDGKQYYVQKGIVEKFTGLVTHTNGKQYYVKDGVRQKTTGIVTHTNGKQYYVENGIRQNITGIVTHTNKKQYYVEDGVRQHTTGIVKHTNGKQYYVKDGVRQNTTGLVKHTNNKWYYVEKGVRQTTTGLVLHTNGKLHYVKSGVLDKTFNGKWKHTDGKTYTVVNGVAK